MKITRCRKTALFVFALFALCNGLVAHARHYGDYGGIGSFSISTEAVQVGDTYTLSGGAVLCTITKVISSVAFETSCVGTMSNEPKQSPDEPASR